MKMTYKTVEYDYKDHDELLRHMVKMSSRGWGLIKKYEIEETRYTWHAIYASGYLFNGINGR